MSDKTRAAAAPSQIELDGKTYSLSPMTLGDMAEFAQFAEDRELGIAEARITRLEKNSCCTDEKKRELLEKAFDRIDSGRAEAAAALDFAGLSFLGHLSLRHKHPELKPDDVAKLVSVVGMKEFQSRIDRMSGLEKESPDPNAGTAPANQAEGRGDGSTES